LEKKLETFDVIVIGGSVSGAPTAMLLARHGHKVLLVEKSVFPRDTNSTHFIWPRGISYLNRWGVADHILDSTPHYRNMEVNIEGISLVGSIPLEDLKRRFRKLHGDDRGVIDYYCGPRRYFLDNHLLNCAKEAGVDVREGVTYNSPIVENGRVVGINASRQNGTAISARAKLVIGADGRFSRFVKDVGSKDTDFRALSTFAYFSYFSGIDKEQLSIHKRGRFGTAIFPTLDKTHMVLVYGPCAYWEDFRKNAEQNFFDIYRFCAPDVAKQIENGKRTEAFKAASRMEAFQRESHGPGWALVGDAGSFKDQVTAMGISHSFRDAELISGYIHRALAGEFALDEALDEYQKVRAADYVDYFDLVCKTAEMNGYSKEDLKYFYSIRNDQAMIDQMLSQFGDTLPPADGATAKLLADSEYPGFINDFDPAGYRSSFPLSSAGAAELANNHLPEEVVV
jgi:2-polyprenyl-6-methoxyphenol hydroxylase-like FAD-dependent oxidoreductase